MRFLLLLFSVFSSLLVATPDWLQPTSNAWKEYKQETINHIGSLPGWCSAGKAEKMMDLILEVKPNICAEIGVFGGSSMFPTARALNYILTGRVYCIDSWAQQPAIEGYSVGNPHYEWWSRIDYDGLLNGFLKMLSERNLANRCAILRMRSEDAVSWFADESIDILHIDGNHATEAVLKDVRLFLPKVKRGGYIWFDDADWPSTLPAQKLLLIQCFVIKERSEGNSCLLFQKR